MVDTTTDGRRLGVALVGLGGAVATTAVAGIELLRLAGGERSGAGTEGLPLAAARTADGRPLEEVAGLAAYADVIFAGWDLASEDLAKAVEVHGVLDRDQREAVADTLVGITPWPAIGSTDFCRNVTGDHTLTAPGHRAAVDALVGDLKRFRVDERLDGLVVVNVASTERIVDRDAVALQTPAAFEEGLDADDPAIGPAMLYAYAALLADAPYANFTPSTAVDVPALLTLADERGVPVAGKDGKTGQTMMKTVLAPAFRERALRVEGWYSTNILGNRDGEALDDPASLASKQETKGAVLDELLGYHVDDHLVRIDYYRPRGDAKEAWDNIDLVGFLGQRMQVKVDFLCRDSILAAPLVVEIARVLDVAHRRGHGGPLEELGVFFKAPLTRDGGAPEHALHRQSEQLLTWLAEKT